MAEQHPTQTSGNFEYHLVEGTLYITHADGKRQLALTPEEAYDLLDYLYLRRKDLHVRTRHPVPTELPGWVHKALQDVIDQDEK